MDSEKGRQNLKVRVVALAFAPGPEAAATFGAALSIDASALCAAIVPSSEAESLRREWHGADDQCLSIFHLLDEEPIDLAVQLLTLLPRGPVAVLIANFPPLTGFKAVFEARSRADTIRRLARARPDIQVQVFDNSWRRRPPRVV